MTAADPSSVLEDSTSSDVIYLDHNSTSAMPEEVANEMFRVHRVFAANPSSQHQPGSQAAVFLETTLDDMAERLGLRTVGMDSDRIIVTSGGTESNNLAISGLVSTSASSSSLSSYGANTESPEASGSVAGRVITSAMEHPSVLGPIEHLRSRGLQVDYVDCNSNGTICLAHLENLLTNNDCESPVRLVSLQMANNETGAIQPIAAAARLCRQAGVRIHTDAAQSIGKMPVSFSALGVDAMSIAPHKFGGPVGVGLLILRSGVTPEPQIFGGHQQLELRPGTLPLAGVAGVGKSLELATADLPSKMEQTAAFRHAFEKQLIDAFPEITINSADAPRLCNTSNVSFPEIDRQALFMALDMAGVACSTGSACASGSSEPSPVLAAMGLDSARIDGALRFSLGTGLTLTDIRLAASRIIACYQNLRSRN